MIKVGLPKGRRLDSDSRRLCLALGIQVEPGVLSYQTRLDDVAVGVYLMKSPDIARMLGRNRLDLGLAGDDWLMEAGIPVRSWCFDAAPYTASVCLLMTESDRRPVRSIQSLITPYPNLARSLLHSSVPGLQVAAVSGSSEGLVPDLGDACLDLVETGSTAALNGLAVRESFGAVSAHVARSERSVAAALESIVELLAGARVAVL